MPRGKGKLSKGQPQGARSASGRKRDRVPKTLQPCDGVQRRRELYRLPANDVGEPTAADRKARRGRQETDTCDALGRAYCAGLLGGGDLAERRLLAGRKIAHQYWRILGFPTPDSLARFQPQAPANRLDPERERILEAALNDGMELVRARGRDVGRAFEQLVIDPNPDHGPKWLDAIVYANRTRRRPAERDSNMMRLALDGLDAIA